MSARMHIKLFGRVIKTKFIWVYCQIGVFCYTTAVKTIEKLSDKKIENIFIVGGGSKDAYLNELTARITGKRVIIGLDEATATGDILSQIMYDENIGLDKARETVKKSFDIQEVRI